MNLALRPEETSVTEKLLDGDAALVTGAASGIGRAIAEALAREGAEVVLADIDEERCRAAAASLAAAGHRAHALAADLAEAGSAERLLAAALAAVGRLGILVHSASPRRLETETALAVSAEEWERMLGVNLRAGFELGRGAGRHMAQAGLRGRILFVTSLHAETPRNLPHYSAAKAGLTMVMKELARALGPHGIRVNAIAPGAVAGGGFQADPRLASRIALGRLGVAEDVAAMAVALLSDRFAGYVTGTTVVVDGGLSLHNWIEPPPT
jgi:3-oxoacyl-[acyl-carrier protein] reductase